MGYDTTRTIEILYDPTDATTIKATAVIKFFLTKVESECEYRLEPVNNAQQLITTVQSFATPSIIVYVFHGNVKGMTIGSARSFISWYYLASTILHDSNHYHLFLSCYSHSLSVLTDAFVDTQSGTTDYLISVFHTLITLSRLITSQRLYHLVLSYLSLSQISIFARLVFPVEPLWGNGTHYYLSELASEYIFSGQLFWLRNLLSVELPSITTTEPNVIISHYFNPDYSDYPSGISSYIFGDINNMSYFYTDPEKLSPALRHVSFNLNLDLDIKYPVLWYSLGFTCKKET